MKEKIETALQRLVGLPFVGATRTADLASLQFGEPREVATRGGGMKTVGVWALHLQCAWRIREEAKILVASSDCYRPADDWEFSEDFNWDVQGANRRDQLMRSFFENENSLLVTDVAADNFGGFSLQLASNFTFEAFPEITAPDIEHWRLFQPAKHDAHFVVTTAGIED